MAEAPALGDHSSALSFIPRTAPADMTGPDIIFLTYDEPNAEENWRRLLVFAPAAKRVSGVAGMYNAFCRCAEVADSDFFFLVDGDSWILDTFRFEPPNASLQGDACYAWLARNAVNGLLSHNGSVKLLSKGFIGRMRPDGIDFVLSSRSPRYSILKVASESRFNATPFLAWRTGFRACTKYASRSVPLAPQVTDELLRVWQTSGAEKPHGRWAIRGAREGAAYGLQNRGDHDAILKLNDYGWLQARFEDSVSNEQELSVTASRTDRPLAVQMVRHESDRLRGQYRLLGPEFDFPESAGPTWRYMIASMPRSGSSLLAMRLWGTGALGAPLEYFNLESWMPAMITRLQTVTLDDYLHHLLALRTSPNGVFGLKAHFMHYRLLHLYNIWPRLLPERILFIDRRDVVAQAVSAAIAAQTRQFSSLDRQEGTCRYEPALIDRMLHIFQASRQNWQRALAKLPMPRLEITYEGLVAEPEQTLDNILTFLGVERRDCAPVKLPEMERQGTGRNREWVDRFRAERGIAAAS